MAKRLSESQLRLLATLREATDMESCFHRSGAANAPGMIAHGNTIRSLVLRKLAKCTGFGDQVDGDGFIERHDQPVYVITSLGRRALRGDDHG